MLAATTRRLYEFVARTPAGKKYLCNLCGYSRNFIVLDRTGSM